MKSSESTLINVSVSGRVRSRLPQTALICTLATALAGCGSLASQNSPDVIYSEAAVQARDLQVPPDLTDVSNAEQFVLPGTGNAAVARNTLLPQFDSLRFVREGGQHWLEFQQSPEDLWPQLLDFLKKEKYRIEQTEPVAGVIATQWRPASAVGSTSILRNLVAGEEFSRVAFRLERAGAGARLFARSQVTSQEAVESAVSIDTDWPTQSHDPESTSALLNRFLAFLGVEQQKARRLLDDEQASAVLDDAVLQSNASGSEVIINRGFQSSFRQMIAGLQALDYTIITSDDNAGRIEFMDEETPLVIQLSPIHVSAVRASLTNAQGGKLPTEQEQELLAALAQQLA